MARRVCMTGQPELRFHPRGGCRPGAGRKKGLRVSHAQRPRFEKPTPVHVTLRVKAGTWSLRSQRSYRRITACIAALRARSTLRVIEYSVMGNHLHFVVEADDHVALSRGMQALMVRIAKALNRMMQRAGRVFDDHFHARLLKTPTELVRALRYVLCNHEHHFGTRGLDPFCSASLAGAERRSLLKGGVGWLLREGWKKALGGVRVPGWT